MARLSEVVSVCYSADAATWKIAAPRIIEFIDAESYKLIVPEHEVEIFKSISPHQYKVLSEKLYVPDWQALLAKHRPPQRGNKFGWYLQQFIKLSAIAAAPEEASVLIWDADTIPLKKLDFIDQSGHYLFYKDQGFHAPYFSTIKKLLNLSRQQQASFISQCFVTKGAWIQEMIKDIELRHQRPWQEAIMQCLDIRLGLCFSEYETLGTFIAHQHPNEIRFTDRPWSRDGVRIFGGVENFGHSRLSGQNSNLDYVSFEKSQANSRTHVQRILKALRRVVKRIRKLFLTNVANATKE
jgi:Family of unknown function (DUF6492)